MKINPRLKKIITYCAYTVTALLIILVSVALYFNISGKAFFVCGRALMWVKTASMESVIPQQSYILVKEIDAKEVKVGDVIVFYSDDADIYGKLNAHRVVDITADGNEFVTRGDNNGKNDDVTAKAQKVVGVYSTNLPFLSAIGRFLSTALGITVMIILIFGINLAVFLPEVFEYQKKKMKKAQIDSLIKEEVQKLKAQNVDDQKGEK